MESSSLNELLSRIDEWDNDLEKDGIPPWILKLESVISVWTKKQRSSEGQGSRQRYVAPRRYD